MDRHAIIIPTYNERENIGLLVEEILNLGLDSQVIIVDDNSPDGPENSPANWQHSIQASA